MICCENHPSLRWFFFIQKNSTSKIEMLHTYLNNHPCPVIEYHLNTKHLVFIEIHCVGNLDESLLLLGFDVTYHFLYLPSTNVMFHRILFQFLDSVCKSLS